MYSINTSKHSGKQFSNYLCQFLQDPRLPLIGFHDQVSQIVTNLIFPCDAWDFIPLVSALRVMALKDMGRANASEN